MKVRKLFKYRGFDAVPFAQRPKGELMALSVNPYSGNVILTISNYLESKKFALENMRVIVYACDALENLGIDDPLELLMSDEWDVEILESLVNAANVKRDRERGNDAEEEAAGDKAKFEKVG